MKEKLEKLGFSVIIQELKEDTLYIFLRAGVYIKGTITVDKKDNKVWKITLDGNTSDLYQINKIVEEYNYEE